MTQSGRQARIGTLATLSGAALAILAAASMATPATHQKPAAKPPAAASSPCHISFAGAGNRAFSVTSPIVGNLPPSLAKGDLLVASLTIVPSARDLTAPPGWQLITVAGPTTGLSLIEQHLYYYVMGPVPSTTWSWSIGEGYASLNIAAYSGVDPDRPLRQFATTTTGEESIPAGRSFKSPSLYGQAGNRLLITFGENWSPDQKITQTVTGSPALAQRWAQGTSGETGDYLGDATLPSSGATTVYSNTFGTGGFFSAVSAAVELRCPGGPWEPIPTITPTAAPTINQAAAAGPPVWPMYHHDVSHSGRSQFKAGASGADLKWKFTVGDPVGGSPAIGPDGTIYVGSGTRIIEPLPSYFHDLYAVNSNGTVRWKYKTEGDMFSSPAIGSDGAVYAGSNDGSLYALKLDGTLEWKFDTRGAIASSPAIGADGTIFFGSGDSYLYAVSPIGVQKWRFQTGGNIYSSPAIAADGTIYAGSEDCKFYALTAQGMLRWKTELGCMFASPAIGAGGTIYIGSDDHNLYALSPDGTLKWQFPTGAAIRSSPAIGADGTIYTGSTDNNLYALTPAGTLKWRYAIAGVFSSPAIDADGTIFAGSEDGNLYALAPDGTLTWKLPLGGSIQLSSPAIGADGTIYIGSVDGKLYAIDTHPAAAVPR